MKKILILILLGLFSLGFSQKKKGKSKTKAVVEKEIVIIYTEQDAETSNEPRIIAGFLKQNPNHERVGYFKRKLVEIIMADNSDEAKPNIKPINQDKIANIVKSNELNEKVSKEDIKENIAKAAKAEALSSTNSNKKFSNSTLPSSKASAPSEENKRTAAMLTHLFSTDPNNTEAYINIRNKSKCNLIVKFSGKKYYNLDVPANGQNFILIDKGNYVLTTMVCDAKYSSVKKISKDIEITLNNN